MRKVILPVLALILFSSSGAGAIDSKIQKNSCPADYEPLISMSHPNKTFNNPGHPALYDYKVCVSGIIGVDYEDQCSGGTAFYLSSNETDAHLSTTSGYNRHVCTGNMLTEVRSSCQSNQTTLFSISNKINGKGRHVAGLSSKSPYSDLMCAFYAKPSNVTLQLKFNVSSTDEVYFDGDQKTGSFSYSGLAEYPYLVSTSGSFVSGIVSRSFLKAEREIETRNVLRLKKDSDKASYFIPFTEGDQTDIEDSQDEILNNEFISQISPSFGFFSPNTPTIRAFLKPDADINSSLSIGAGSYEVKIEKTGENKVTISER